MRRLGPASGATVQDIVTQQKITLSGLTAIDLAGLTRLELAFALVMAAGGVGARARARLGGAPPDVRDRLGSRCPRTSARGVRLERGAYVTVGGLLFGAVAGWGLSYVIVKILTGVFDPPPEHLTIPWTYLVTLALATVAAVGVAGAGMLRASRRPAVEIVRDL